jgi:hypothetical protein
MFDISLNFVQSFVGGAIYPSSEQQFTPHMPACLPQGYFRTCPHVCLYANPVSVS